MPTSRYFDWSDYKHEINEFPINVDEIVKRFPTHELQKTLPTKRDHLSVRAKLQEFFERNPQLEIAFRAILDDISTTNKEVFLPAIQPSALTKRARELHESVSRECASTKVDLAVVQKRSAVRTALEKILSSTDPTPETALRKLSTLVAEVGFAYEYLNDLDSFSDYRPVANAAFQWASANNCSASSLDGIVAAFIADEVIDYPSKEKGKAKSA